jgi:hypothetical protein
MASRPKKVRQEKTFENRDDRREIGGLWVLKQDKWISCSSFDLCKDPEIQAWEYYGLTIEIHHPVNR